MFFIRGKRVGVKEYLYIFLKLRFGIVFNIDMYWNVVLEFLGLIIKFGKGFLEKINLICIEIL